MSRIERKNITYYFPKNGDLLEFINVYHQFLFRLNDKETLIILSNLEDAEIEFLNGDFYTILKKRELLKWIERKISNHRIVTK